MNPIAHYIVDVGCLKNKLSYLNEKETSDLICGSILPDIYCINIFYNVFKRPFYSSKQTHNLGELIYIKNKEYIKTHALEPFILGTLIHNEVDYLTHNEYNGDVGYIHQISDCIEEKVAKFYNIDKNVCKNNSYKLPESGELAHFLAEVAIDQHIITNDRYIEKNLSKNIKSFNENVNIFSKAVNDYYSNNYLLKGFAFQTYLGFVRYTMKPYLAKLTIGLSYFVGYSYLAGFRTLQDWFDEVQKKAVNEKYSYTKFLDYCTHTINDKLTGNNVTEDIEALLQNKKN